MAHKVRFFKRFHSGDEVRYAATDREFHLLGILCAGRGLGAQGGEYTFPSGLTMRLIPEEAGFLIDTPRQVRADDLPEWTREHFERMDPERQPKGMPGSTKTDTVPRRTGSASPGTRSTDGMRPHPSVCAGGRHRESETQEKD